MSRKQESLAPIYESANAAIMTIIETLLWHVWYFWSPILVRSWIGELPFFRTIPVPVQLVLIGSSCKMFWYTYMTFQRPSQIEQALSKYLRSPPGQRRFDILILEIVSVVVALLCFAQWWNALDRVSALAKKPSLPDLKSPITGETINVEIWRHSNEVSGALITEFALSCIHWYGVGLTVLSHKVGLRNMSWYSTFMTPMLINFGTAMPTGRPGINSSVSLIAAFKNRDRFWDILPLAFADTAASCLVIIVPRIKAWYLSPRVPLRDKQVAMTASTVAVGSSIGDEDRTTPSEIEPLSGGGTVSGTMTAEIRHRRNTKN